MNFVVVKWHFHFCVQSLFLSLSLENFPICRVTCRSHWTRQTAERFFYPGFDPSTATALFWITSLNSLRTVSVCVSYMSVDIWLLNLMYLSCSFQLSWFAASLLNWIRSFSFSSRCILSWARKTDREAEMTENTSAWL